MEVTRGNLANLFLGFSASFTKGVGEAKSQYELVSTPVPSNTRKMEYGWLGKIPSVRQWIGPRQVNALTRYAYEIENEDWENTIEVDRNDVEDDNLGIYGPMFEQMGRSTGAHPDQLVFDALKNGFTEPCYDGQPFFDAEHIVMDANGRDTVVANTDAQPGGGAPWFLVDTSQVLKPIIFQKRKDWLLVRKDRPEDSNVFDEKKFVYGADARYAAGYGFWQFAWGSTAALTSDSYGAARAALMGMKGDYGRPIGVMPDTLFFPPALELAAREIVVVDRNAAGATNPWQGTAKPVNVPWLA